MKPIIKRIAILSGVLMFAFAATNCEKDDICDAATVTTSRLIVTFYDKANPTVLKQVTNLQVTGDGLETALGTFSNVSEIKLPLKTTDDLTTYRFQIYSTDENLANEDIIQFNYARDNVFVSRACGYKTVFELNDTTPFLLSDTDPADGLWMNTIVVEKTNIDSENETHISIRF